MSRVLKEVLVWVHDPRGFVKMLEKKGKPWLAGAQRYNENTCCSVLVDFWRHGGIRLKGGNA